MTAEELTFYSNQHWPCCRMMMKIPILPSMKMKDFDSLPQKCSKDRCSLRFSSAGKSRASNFSFYSWLASHISHWNEDAPGQDLSEHSHLASEEVAEGWLHRPVLLSSHCNDTQFHHLKKKNQPTTGGRVLPSHGLQTAEQQHLCSPRSSSHRGNK